MHNALWVHVETIMIESMVGLGQEFRQFMEVPDTEKLAPSSHDLNTLLDQRAALCGALASVGDFRPGTLRPRYRRYGKRNCHCAREGGATESERPDAFVQ